MRTIAGLLGMAAMAGLALAPAGAQEKAGRYALSPAEGGGYVRLDTQTGQMSLCHRRSEQWVCQEMADRSGGLGDEVERLRKENRELKGEIRRMEDLALGSPDKEAAPPARADEAPAQPEQRAERPGGRGGQGGGKFPLPTEQDVDQAMTYVQRMLRKFREKMREIERDANGMPL